MNEWDNEPDEWEGEMCYAMRHSEMGHWCGYIGLPEGHPWFGEQQIDAYVHGGITFTADHKPQQDPDGLWWVGFDCAHACDIVPGLQRLTRIPGATYKTLEFVQRQIVQLMEQAVEVRRPKHEDT